MYVLDKNICKSMSYPERDDYARVFIFIHVCVCVFYDFILLTNIYEYRNLKHQSITVCNVVLAIIIDLIPM